jgi:hypothetical protein
MKMPDCYDPFDSQEQPVMLRVETNEKWGFPLAQIRVGESSDGVIITAISVKEMGDS